jgi:hypothetical protein
MKLSADPILRTIGLHLKADSALSADTCEPEMMARSNSANRSGPRGGRRGKLRPCRGYHACSRQSYVETSAILGPSLLCGLFPGGLAYFGPGDQKVSLPNPLGAIPAAGPLSFRKILRYPPKIIGSRPAANMVPMRTAGISGLSMISCRDPTWSSTWGRFVSKLCVDCDLLFMTASMYRRKLCRLWVFVCSAADATCQFLLLDDPVLANSPGGKRGIASVGI